MNLPPQRTGSGESKLPPPARPAGSLPPVAHGAPPQKPQPTVHASPVRKRGGGPSLLTILLTIFGGMALVILLFCGGIGWFVYSKVQQTKRAFAEAQAQAQANSAESPFHVAPPPPDFGRRFPGNQAIDSIPNALAALDDFNHFRREEAANYLADQPVDESQRAAVLAKALPMLGDWTKREQARRVVDKWISADNATELLAAAQQAHARNDRDTQHIMIQMLAKTGDERAADAVVQYLATEHDTGAAKRALVELGATHAEKVLPLFNHRGHGVRAAARELLTQFGVEEAAIARQCLADIGSGERDRQREAARWLAQHKIDDEALTTEVSAALLQQLGVREVRSDIAAALGVWTSPDDVPTLIAAAQAASTAQDREAQREIVQLLAATKDKRALPVLADYFAARHDIFAARKAFETFGSGAAEALLSFANSPDGSVQHFARQLLSQWEVPASAFVGQSVKDLASADMNRRRSIANWLAQQQVDAEQQAAVAKALEPLLDDPTSRREAIRALRVWATPANVPKLLTLLDDSDMFFRSEVMQVLVQLKDPRAVPYIAAGFAEDFSRRHEAARHLRALGPMAESAVWPHTSNADWQVAMDACNVLKDIGTRRSLPALQLATQHQNPAVKSTAAAAIKEVEAAKRTVEATTVATTDKPKPAARGLREWKDASGKNTIQAEFIEFASGKVKLKTKAGKTLALSMNQLSPDDRRYVIELMQAP